MWSKTDYNNNDKDDDGDSDEENDDDCSDVNRLINQP